MPYLNLPLLDWEIPPSLITAYDGIDLLFPVNLSCVAMSSLDSVDFLSNTENASFSL